ncbi:MAG: hypothetical protein GC155_12090 [Alphaproteobacteria bacterium]|nr:hypothetical protein [Alphaproteobacteria bacterium]
MADPNPGKPGKKPRTSKKSETLEVRLPYETKQAFLTACREDGTTASEVVRGTIDDYLDARERPSPPPETGRLLEMISRPIRKKRYMLAGAGVLAAGLAVALPSAAGPDMRAAFNRLDANKDGVLSADEFEGSKSGADKKVVVIEHRTGPAGADADKDSGKDANRAGAPAVTEKAFAFWLPDDAAPPGAKPTGGDDKDHAVVIEKHEVRVRKDGDADGPVITADFRKSEFDRFDANRDGKVTYDEYQSAQTAMLTSGFNLLDENHDGYLSQKEYAKIGMPMMIQDKVDATGKPDAGPDIQIVSKPAMDAKALKARFKKLDKNGDGKLSLEEYLP